MRRLYLALFFIVSGCSDLEIAPSIGIVKKFDNSCGCGQSVYVKNSSSKEASVTYKKTIDDGESPPSIKKTIRLGPAGGSKSQRFLGCTQVVPRDAPTGTTTCSSSQQFLITNKEFSFNRGDLTITHAQLRQIGDENYLVNANFETLKGSQCARECFERNSGRCELLSGVSKEYIEGITRLSHEVSNANGSIIEKYKIMEWFGQNNDLCERSDILVLEDRIVNSGLPCSMRISYQLGHRLDRVDVVLPDRLEGKLTRGVESTLIQFQSPSKALLLRFSDRHYERYYGGMVTEISDTHSGIAVASERGGCIGVVR